MPLDSPSSIGGFFIRETTHLCDFVSHETKSTKDYEKLRNSEAEKIRCGRKHFEAITTNFDVVISAEDV
jgi:restriction endonuclease